MHLLTTTEEHNKITILKKLSFFRQQLHIIHKTLSCFFVSISFLPALRFFLPLALPPILPTGLPAPAGCSINEDLGGVLHIVFKLSSVMDIQYDNIKWDSSKSDGCMKKTVSNNKLLSIFPNTKFTNIDDGLKIVHEFYKR